MSGRGTALLARLVVLALVQTVVLGWMVWDRVSLLRHGREIVLDVEPVDPRDLFRGDYVVLRYRISRLIPAALEGEDDFARNDRIYVALRPTQGQSWQPFAVHKALPGVTGDVVFLRGRVSEVRRITLRPTGEPATEACKEGCTALFVDYGIESYFVPEGTGKELEERRDQRLIQAIVRVSDTGKAAIRALMVGGTLRHQEPLY